MIHRSKLQRSSRDAALAADHQRPVSALDSQGLDIGSDGFGDS
jgi:hypothetical protein